VKAEKQEGRMVMEEQGLRCIGRFSVKNGIGVFVELKWTTTGLFQKKNNT